MDSSLVTCYDPGHKVVVISTLVFHKFVSGACTTLSVQILQQGISYCKHSPKWTEQAYLTDIYSLRYNV